MKRWLVVVLLVIGLSLSACSSTRTVIQLEVEPIRVETFADKQRLIVDAHDIVRLDLFGGTVAFRPDRTYYISGYVRARNNSWALTLDVIKAEEVPQ